MTEFEGAKKFEELRAKAILDESGILQRALDSGLADRLWFQLSQEGNYAEYLAWHTAAVCGSVGILNECILMPGYETARESVDEYLIARILEAECDDDLQRLLGEFREGGTFSVSSALRTHWLPLGLWALSDADMVDMLSRFTIHGHLVNDRDPERRACFREQHPELNDVYENSPLLELDASNDPQVAAAARRLKLARVRPAPAKLIKIDGQTKFVLRDGSEAQGLF